MNRTPTPSARSRDLTEQHFARGRATSNGFPAIESHDNAVAVKRMSPYMTNNIRAISRLSRMSRARLNFENMVATYGRDQPPVPSLSTPPSSHSSSPSLFNQQHLSFYLSDKHKHVADDAFTSSYSDNHNYVSYAGEDEPAAKPWICELHGLRGSQNKGWQDEIAFCGIYCQRSFKSTFYILIAEGSEVTGDECGAYFLIGTEQKLLVKTVNES
ncbi:hypothetical protein N431DRAFT_441650 [Stipitochalara longipes BDJ]|nr:hypothetical protein N431DRAFT_441650 [Stipitochalara longipes BDJ]